MTTRSDTEGLLREALEVIAAKPERAPDAIGITARNIARAALDRALATPPNTDPVCTCGPWKIGQPQGHLPGCPREPDTATTHPYVACPQGGCELPANHAQRARDALLDIGYYYGETYIDDPITPRWCWLRSDGAGSSVPVSEDVSELLDSLALATPPDTDSSGLDVEALAERMVAAGQPLDVLTAAGWRIVITALRERFPELAAAIQKSRAGLGDVEAALWKDIVGFIRWSANVRDDRADAMAVARKLLDRFPAAIQESRAGGGLAIDVERLARALDVVALAAADTFDDRLSGADAEAVATAYTADTADTGSSPSPREDEAR